VRQYLPPGEKAGCCAPDKCYIARQNRLYFCVALFVRGGGHVG
jgi:hypothetical protein